MYIRLTEKYKYVEALAMAGVLTIWKRDRIRIMREEDIDTHRHIITLADPLNDANIICSPYFYLQQNDIVYVET